MKTLRAMLKNMPSLRDQRGFTLVEMLLAMAIFSFVAILMAQGVISMIRFYQSSIDIRATQQQAREVANELSTDASQSYIIGVSRYTGACGAGSYCTAAQFGTQQEDAVCFFQAIKPGANPNQVSGKGVAYYTKENPAGSNQWYLYKANFDNLTENLNGNNNCPASSFGSSTLVSASGASGSSSPGVSLIRFDTQVSSDNRLVSVDAVIAGSAELSTANITYPAYPATPTCKGGNDNRFCSITHIQLGLTAREPAQ